MVNVNENHFLDENDIVDLMQLDTENLKGASLDQVNLKEVERKIKREPFIKDAQLYSDLEREPGCEYRIEKTYCPHCSGMMDLMVTSQKMERSCQYPISLLHRVVLDQWTVR